MPEILCIIDLKQIITANVMNKGAKKPQNALPFLFFFAFSDYGLV